jgi:glycosyltransferase involved in cell wall biosynthesis
VDDLAQPRLRVLFLARLFAGLKPGLAEGRWNPAGVPAIYHLLEGLYADPEVDLMTVFCVKEADARFAKRIRRRIAGIGDTIILPYRTWLGPQTRSLNTAATELDSAARILALAARFRPDLVYASYATLLPAALLASAGYKVVLRFLGVVPHHRQIASGGSPVFRFLLRSPFAYVLSTEDGSDPAAVVPKLLRPGTPWSVRLNGCDAGLRGGEAPASDTAEDARERPVVLFVGRLEPYKGALDFIEAALALLKSMPDGADFILVGDGPLKAEMQGRVEAAGGSARIRFVGSKPHAEVARYLAQADIYVSTNMYGNLSNANLEALGAGTCLVLPTSDMALPLDTVTDTLIPGDVARRYDRNGLPGSLAETLGDLIRSPAEIAERRVRTAELARKLLKPWAQSVAEDLALLKSIARRSSAPAVASQRS